MQISIISRGNSFKTIPDKTFEGSFEEFAKLFESYNANRSKHDGYFVRGLLNGKRSNNNLSKADLLVIDGDQSDDNENSAPDPNQLHNLLLLADINHFIYTTHSYDPPDKIKWRCVIPCALESKQLKPTLNKLFSYFSTVKYPLVDVKENSTWSQPWYFPNREKDDGHYIYLSHFTGQDYEPVDLEEAEEVAQTQSDSTHYENLLAIREGNSYYKELQNVIWGMAQDGRTEEAIVCDIEMIMMASKACAPNHEHHKKWEERFNQIPTYAKQAILASSTEQEIPDYKEYVEKQRELQWPPGPIGELAQNFFEMAPHPNKEMAIIGAIGLVSGITGRHYNVNGTGLNIYATLLADSGMGKSIIKDGINQALISADPLHSATFIGPARFTGPKALFNSLQAGMSKICIFEESGLMNESKAGDQQGLTRVVLEAYSSSGTGKVLGGEGYSDKKDSLKMLHSPALSIINVSTPKSYLSAMKNKSAELSGEIARIWMTRTFADKPKYNRDRAYNFDKKHIDRIAELMKRCIVHQDPESWNEKIVDIPIKNPAHYEDGDYWTEKYNDYKKQTDNLRMAMTSRAWVKVLKLSAVCSIYNGYDYISDEEYEWAKKVIIDEIEFVMDTFTNGSNDGMAMITRNIMAPAISKMLSAKMKTAKAIPNNKMRAIGAFTYSNINQALRANSVLSDLDDDPARNNPKTGLQKLLEYMIMSGYIFPMKESELKIYAKRATKAYKITSDFSLLD